MGRLIHGNIVLDTLTQLKAQTAYKSAVVQTLGYSAAGDGGGGLWRFDDSDLSTEVTADPLEGFYAPPDSDSTGASGAWVRLSSVLVVQTTTNITDVSHAVNTIGKYQGRQIYDLTADQPLWAAGPAAADVWVDAQGATTISPV